MIEAYRRSWANIQGKGKVRGLFETVVFSGVCSGCAACVLACPVDNAMSYQGDKPVLLEGCIDCLLCSQACPRLDYQREDTAAMLLGGPQGRPDGGFGSYKAILGARSTAEGVRSVGQDGGVVTALLLWALARGLIQGAAVSGRAEDWQTVPRLATTSEQILACAGSRYTYCPNPLALREAKAQGLEKVALVGPGCEIAAVRQLQAARSKRSREVVRPVVVSVGLLCSETFTYGGLEKVHQERGLNLKAIAKINIKGKVLVYLKSGEQVSIPLKEVRPFVRDGCHYCQDFSAEHADLSVGGLGLDGWTVCLLRTQAGEDFFRGAVRDEALETRSAEDFPSALDLLSRLAAKQRARPPRPAAAGAT